MLRRGDRERRREKRKKTAFKKFRSRTEKRDGAIGSGNRRWLPRLWDRENQRLFPDRRKNRVTDRKIEDRGEKRDGTWPKVLQMDLRNPIRPSGCRGFGLSDCSFDVSVNERRLARHQLLLPNPLKDLPRNRELFVRAYGCELLVEFFQNSSAFGVGFAFE